MERRASAWQQIGLALVSTLVAVLLRGLGATWRVKSVGESPFRPGIGPVIGALWHEAFLVAAWLYRDRDVVVMVSRSRDGDRITALLSRLGFAGAARGSSSRAGASALRQQITAVAEGRHGALLCDGPRGPARRAKLGAIALARGTGRPLQPVFVSARPALRFGSWDRTLLPLPFARVVCAYGPRIAVDEDAPREICEAALQRLEEEMLRLERVADAALRRGGVETS